MSAARSTSSAAPNHSAASVRHGLGAVLRPSPLGDEPSGPRREVIMKRDQLNSSMMLSAGYDTATRTLEIEFARGAIYRYFDVPTTERDAFLAAPSKGRFFNARIRRLFACQRVDAS